MKEIKTRFILRLNVMLGAIVGVLTGCGSCQTTTNRSDEVMAMYGIPMASYQVSGTVRNAQNEPVADAQVVVKGYKNFAIGDTVRTNAQGTYNARLEGWPVDTVNVVATDPATQKSDSAQATVRFEREGDWNSTAKPMTVDVQIK